MRNVFPLFFFFLKQHAVVLIAVLECCTLLLLLLSLGSHALLPLFGGRRSNLSVPFIEIQKPVYKSAVTQICYHNTS